MTHTSQSGNMEIKETLLVSFSMYFCNLEASKASPAPLLSGEDRYVPTSQTFSASSLPLQPPFFGKHGRLRWHHMTVIEKPVNLIYMK